MADNKNTKDDRSKLSAVWNAAPSEIGLDDKITIIKNWSYKALKYLPPWIMPEAIESDGYYFVAHSRKDFKIVYTDILRLESVGVDIWYDRSMEPGRNWQEIAERMMNRQECKGVIVYGTVNSMASKPVQINHDEDLKTTAAKDLYEKACKDKEAKEAEETSEEDRERVERFKDLLARIGNANITYIDLAHPAARKKELLDKIKSEEVLLYDKSDRDRGVITGVKYLGVREVKIPKNVTIDGEEYDVIEIGACAFANCRALEMVALPESLKFMGKHAFFGCASLTKVHLGRNVRYVAENAFENCAKLEEVSVSGGNKHIIVKDRIYYGPQPHRGGYSIIFVPRDLEGGITLLDGLKQINEHAFGKRRGITSVTIPDSVTSIGWGAFSGCDSLISVTIGNGVTSIGSCAFYNCTSLSSITIPDCVTSLGDSAFAYCDSLTSVTIPNSVTSIGSSAFYGCDSLTSLTIPNSVTSIGDRAFWDCTSLTSITIPDGVTSIGNYAFWRCSYLTSLTIPDSVTSIEDAAFAYCTSLTSITIPDSVTSIGELAFGFCPSLERLTVAPGNPVYRSAGNCIIETEAGTLVQGCNNSVIPTDGSVTSIGSSAFNDCGPLTSITIPDGVKSIGADAFRGCISLTSIIIPDSVASIGMYAFFNCNSLTSIVIPDSVTSIGTRAFGGCSSLESLTVADGNTVYHSAGNCIIETATKTLVVGCKSSVIPDDGSVTSIGAYAFSGCTSLTSVTIGDGVTSIGDYAFPGCTSLTSVTIPNSVTSIGENAFRFCWSLRHVTYSGTVRQWKKLTAKCQGWTGYCPCEVVKCKDGEVPVTAEDRGE